MWSKSKKNSSNRQNELYTKFLRAHKDLDNHVSGDILVNLDRAQTELKKIEKVFKIIEDHKRQPLGNLEEKLKEAMGHETLVEKLKLEKSLLDEATKDVERLTFSFEEMKFLLSLFGHEGGGISKFSLEKVLDTLEKLPTSTKEEDKQILAKLGQGNPDKANAVLMGLIDEIKTRSENPDIGWDYLKDILSKGVGKVAHYNDKKNIYNETLILKTKLEEQITDLTKPKTLQRGLEKLKQKQAAISKYVQELKGVKAIHEKYYVVLGTTIDRDTYDLKSDLKGVEKNLSSVKNKEKKEGSSEYSRRKVQELERSVKVLSFLTKKGRLTQAISEIEDAFSREVKRFDDVLKELDKESTMREHQKILFMPGTPSSSKDKQAKYEENKLEIARLMALLDGIKVEGKTLTEDEGKRWEKIEKQIEMLEYENDALQPDSSSKSNQEIISSLKDGMRLTLEIEKNKNKATSYFKDTKELIRKLREEDNPPEKDDSYSL
ncbi:hypothetical protein [Legionella resiliens]|uniref:Dot/Icm system substrate protein LidA n=1 Tax=Legionella resiliens TaxID=2905958 RepID=A0ABS8WZ18_9GAMM|nr:MULTISPECIES: hypothetical protein [unclassified Legionella]MCE0722598.1 hypothetical protein [Legionella sp. 9fVS26]MCE3531751.1 hypothetical protein [Legionella sp. 8cVS16]